VTVASCAIIGSTNVPLIIKTAFNLLADWPVISGYAALIEPSDVSNLFKEVSDATFCSVQLVSCENWSQQFPTGLRV
jgi:hypothetical protein